MRYYLDENISYQIAQIARQFGVDVTSSQECGNNGKPDELQLQYAAERGYCIVTFDHDDFLALADEWLTQGRTHAGILLLTPSLPPESRNFAAIARALKYHGELHERNIPDLTDWLHPAPGE